MILMGRKLANSAVSAICVGSVLASLVYAAGAVLQLVALDPGHRVAQKILFQWVPAGLMHTNSGRLVDFVADWGFLLDPLSPVMALVVTAVASLLPLSSIRYIASARC